MSSLTRLMCKAFDANAGRGPNAGTYRIDRFTSTPAVRGANNWGVIQFDEEGRVIPTWEDDDDGDAA